MKRRQFIKSAGGVLVFPSIVKSENLMPVKKLIAADEVWSPSTEIPIVSMNEIWEIIRLPCKTRDESMSTVTTSVGQLIYSKTT